MSSSTPEAHLAQIQMLFVQHTAQLRGFITALLPDFSRVDDILQETFLTISQKAPTFELGTNFLGWACTIARYKVLETIRRASTGPLPLAPEVIESLCASAPEPQSEDARLAVLAYCLQQLAPQARRAVELRYQQAHKPAEIARLIGWTPNSVYVALSRARDVLRDCVETKLRHQPA